MPVFHPSGSDAHAANASNSSLDGMVRVDPATRPGRRHEQGQPAAQRVQDGEERNRPTGMSGTSVRRAVPAPG